MNHHDHHHHHEQGESEVTPVISYENGVITIELYDQHHKAPELDVSHEKEMHLLIVSADLETYYHGHPVKKSEGIYTLAKPLVDGYYKVYVDIAPKDLNYSVAPITLKVGEPAEEYHKPQLTVDTELVKTVNGYTAELTPRSFKANEEITLHFDLKGATPEPYLGALGHVVILDESGETYIHVHPVSNDQTKFDAMFTEPGIYKLWAEFQFEGQVNVYAYVIDVQ
ncbi:MAG TPA: hypothetical protein VK077_07280 [Virgibacillus sp.]|nr:hypothetical protein [Virgibacillus sp.]